MLAETLTRDVLEHVCPGCPAQQAAREIFFADDLLFRLGGMVGPFVVSAGLIGLLVSKLRRHQERLERELGEEVRS
jgi:hypothetical protein